MSTTTGNHQVKPQLSKSRYLVVARAILAWTVIALVSVACWIVATTTWTSLPSSSQTNVVERYYSTDTTDPGASSGDVNRLRRRLQGEQYDFSFDPNSPEAASLMSFLLLILLSLLLCCCFCGGGRRGGGGGGCCGRCSLCDILAIICLWELCCDREGQDIVCCDRNILENTFTAF